MLSQIAICSLFTYKDRWYFSTKISSHSVMTPINNLISTRTLTYINTEQVVEFQRSHYGERWGGVQAVRKGPKDVVLNYILWPAKETLVLSKYPLHMVLT